MVSSQDSLNEGLAIVHVLGVGCTILTSVAIAIRFVLYVHWAHVQEHFEKKLRNEMLN